MTSLARRKLENHGHQHALAFDFAGAARFEVLLEEDALVRDVLIDDPQAFAVDGDDEAGADLPERFEVGDFVGMRERAGGIAVWSPRRLAAQLRRCGFARGRIAEPACRREFRRTKFRTRRRNVVRRAQAERRSRSKPPSEPTPEPRPTSSSGGMIARGTRLRSRRARD